VARKEPLTYGLAFLNKVASSELLDKLGIRKHSEKAIYHGVRGGFVAAGKAQRTFAKKGKSAARGARPVTLKSGGF
jgi:hypothetical protein